MKKGRDGIAETHLVSSVGQPILSGGSSDFSRETLMDLRFTLVHFCPSFISPCNASNVGAVCRHPVSLSSLKENSLRGDVRKGGQEWQSTNLCQAKVYHRSSIFNGIKQKVGGFKIPVYNSTGMNISKSTKHAPEILSDAIDIQASHQVLENRQTPRTNS
jgi:hypothetical protein